MDYSTAASPVSVALADLDGDHALDVATADADRQAVSVLLNRGVGTLEPKDDYTTAIGPVAVAAATSTATATRISSPRIPPVGLGPLNRGHGNFAAKADYAAAGAPNSLALADFDGDGFLDAAVASPRAPRPGT